MSDLGVLKLKFDQAMDFGDTLPGENDLEIILDTADGVFIGKYYRYNDGQSKRRLNEFTDEPLSWTVTNMTESSLDF
jgi:hypothetical protein